jgi:hypothetical protein
MKRNDHTKLAHVRFRVPFKWSPTWCYAKNLMSISGDEEIIGTLVIHEENTGRSPNMCHERRCSNHKSNTSFNSLNNVFSMKLKAQNPSSCKVSNGLDSQWQATPPLLHYRQIQHLYFNPLNKMEKMHIKDFLHTWLSFHNNLLVRFCSVPYLQFHQNP